MAALASVFVDVLPSTDKFGGALKRQIAKVDASKEGEQVGRTVMRGAERETRKGGKAFVSAGQRLGGGLRAGMLLPLGGISKAFAGVFAGIAAVKVFSGFIADARESQKIARVTAAVIKSTGGAAKITADQVGDLATAISNKTGADDEAVQSGQNLLLTFTNIRNGVGKGNDIFNQASQAVVDMTSALNNGEVSTQNVKASSIQLGKALNDPVKGMTALGKAGVSFNDQQQAQIKTLVKSGNVLGAQKIIMREVGREFRGAAAAAADPLTRLKVIAGNLSESIGGLLLPVVGKFANLLGNTVVPAIYKIGGAFKLVLGDDGAQGFAEVMDNAFGNTGKSVAFFRTVGEGIRQLVFGFRALVAAFKEGDVTSDGFVGVMERIGVALRAVVDFVARNAVPAVRFLSRNFDLVVAAAAALGAALATVKVAAFVGMVRGAVVATRAWFVAQGGLNAALVANPIGLVVAAVATLVAAFVIAYKRSDAFRDIVNRFAQAIMAAAVPALQAVGRFITGTVVPAMVRLGGFLAKNLGPTFSALGTLIVTRIWPALQGLFVRFQQVWPTIRTVIVFVARLVGGLLALVVIILGKVLPIIIRLAGPVFTLLFAAIGKIIGIVAALVRAVAAAAGRIIGNFLTMAGAVINAAAKAFGWVPGIGPKLRDAASKFNTFRDQVNRSLSGVKDRKISVVANLGTSGTGGRNIRLATGGPVFGAGTATSDSIPAMLSNGEHVLTAKEVRAFGGHAAVTAMRKEVVRGFAAGGPVGFDVSPRLTGLAKFGRAIDAFNKRVDAIATKLATAGGGFSANLAGVVNFAKAQAGKPYIWGSAGPAGYDCSGFVSNLVEVAKGLPLYRRLFATGSMRSYPWSNHYNGAFEVGWFTGNPGHTGATVNGVNMESRGGDGVVVGSRSKGANYTFFNQHALLATGGPVPDRPGRIGGDAFRVNHFLNRMDPARRDLYRRLYGLPTAPRGWRWDRLEALVASVVPGGLGRIGGDAFRVNHFLSRMDDGRRDLYRRLYGLPGAPQGWAWAEDETLVRRSFFRRPAASHAGMIQAEDGSWVPRSFFGFAAGGPVFPGDPPFDILDPRGRHFRPDILAALRGALSPSFFDSGGLLPPGVSLAVNGTGRPETVTTGKTMDAVIAELKALRRDINAGVVKVDGRVLRREVAYQNIRNPGTW